jgi:hypothetical protein
MQLLEKIIAKFEVESNLRQLSCFPGYSNKDSTPEASISRKRKMPAGPDLSGRGNGFHSSKLVEKVIVAILTCCIGFDTNFPCSTSVLFS